LENHTPHTGLRQIVQLLFIDICHPIRCFLNTFDLFFMSFSMGLTKSLASLKESRIESSGIQPGSTTILYSYPKFTAAQIFHGCTDISNSSCRWLKFFCYLPHYRKSTSPELHLISPPRFWNKLLHILRGTEYLCFNTSLVLPPGSRRRFYKARRTINKIAYRCTIL
jgi:hypothetical protein